MESIARRYQAGRGLARGERSAPRRWNGLDQTKLYGGRYIITRSYQLDSVSSFPIRHEEFHADDRERQPFAVTATLEQGFTTRRLQMSVQKPVLTPSNGGETVTTSGGSSIEIKVESSQSGGEYGAVLWTVRAGEEPPLHTHSREDELVYVVKGKLIAQVGNTRVEVGPGAYAALPRGVPHTIEVVGDEATLLASFVPGGLERLLVPQKGEQPDPAAFGLTFP
jgi:quercetin dioxygenase-like cupin family protein